MAETKHFIDGSNNQIGGFQGTDDPAGGTEVGIAPEKSTDIWNGSSWDADSTALEAEERSWRDNELVISDFTQLSDTALTGQEVTAWATDRTELRDMPALTGFPTTHTRPTAP